MGKKSEMTEIVCILDRSSSMGIRRDSTIQSFNEFLSDQKRNPYPARVSLVMFSTWVHDEYAGKAIEDVPMVSRENYRPDGNTALWDAIGETVTKTRDAIEAAKKKERPSNVIVVVVTDGEENSSKKWGRQQVSDLRKEMEDKHGWIFIDIACGSDASESVRAVGAQSVGSFDESQTGVEYALRGVSDLVGQYRSNPVQFRTAVKAQRAGGHSAWCMVADASVRSYLIGSGHENIVPKHGHENFATSSTLKNTTDAFKLETKLHADQRRKKYAARSTTVTYRS